MLYTIMKALIIHRNCPKGGKLPYMDENGKVHAGKLARYIATAIELGCDVLKFKDTEITLTKNSAGNESTGN